MLLKNWLLLPLVFLASLAATGCAIGRADTVPASVSGVNYTDQDIHYRLFDPKDPKQTTLAAEDIGPFAAGGVLCCYDVPKTWAPGIQVGVVLRSFDNEARRYRPRQTFIVDLPPYDKSGKAGDVWFINYPDDTVGVVSTAYRPNGDEWPGKIKGWPKPSLVFQRELWERDMRLAQESLRVSKESAAEFDRNPTAFLKKNWVFFLDELKQKRPSKELQMFAGPVDPKFLAYERQWRMRLLEHSQDTVDRLLKVKP